MIDDLEFHDLGSANILGGTGKGLAEAKVRLKKHLEPSETPARKVTHATPFNLDGIRPDVRELLRAVDRAG